MSNLCQELIGVWERGSVFLGSERDWPDFNEQSTVAAIGIVSAGRTFSRFQLSSTMNIHGRYRVAIRLWCPYYTVKRIIFAGYNKYEM